MNKSFSNDSNQGSDPFAKAMADLKSPRAPAGMRSRILRQLEAEHAKPFWKKSWWQWSPIVRGLFVLVVLGELLLAAWSVQKIRSMPQFETVVNRAANSASEGWSAASHGLAYGVGLWETLTPALFLPLCILFFGLVFILFSVGTAAYRLTFQTH